jgi:hypothetical protein
MLDVLHERHQVSSQEFVGEGQIAQQLDPKRHLVSLEMSIKSSALTADGSFSQHTFVVRRG